MPNVASCFINWIPLKACLVDIYIYIYIAPHVFFLLFV